MVVGSVTSINRTRNVTKLCRYSKRHTVDSQKFVYSKFCAFTENRFLRVFNFAKWPQHGVLAIHLKWQH